jgi:hypothetical protein
MEFVTKEKEEMDEVIKTTTIPKELDLEKINKLLINARKRFYGIKQSDKRLKIVPITGGLTHEYVDEFDNNTENGG